MSKWSSLNSYRHIEILNLFFGLITKSRCRGSVVACPALFIRIQVLFYCIESVCVGHSACVQLHHPRGQAAGCRYVAVIVFNKILNCFWHKNSHNKGYIPPICVAFGVGACRECCPTIYIALVNEKYSWDLLELFVSHESNRSLDLHTKSEFSADKCKRDSLYWDFKFRV